MKYSKTVYSLIYPESREILGNLWTSQPFYLYEKAYENHQDKYHEDFLNQWKNWSNPIVQVDYNLFPFSYPTAGSTEGIRETLVSFANDSRQKNIEPVIHVFQGEYEGYEAQAKGYGIKVIKHDRNNWSNSLNLITENHYFFLSQPSAIDGNIWGDYDSFLSHIETKNNVKVFVDLCYVGCVAKDFAVNLKYNCIERFCFSLSKVFGVYYHRIGGIFSKSAIPGLYGNIWFKNLFSLNLGTELMKKFNVYQLPRQYQFLQEIALTNFPGWKASDVLILAYTKTENSPEFTEYNRGPNFRICLTPLMDEKLCIVYK